MLLRSLPSRSLFRSFSSTAYPCDTVGFIGLGNMGAPMASNLINGGHDLVVFDKSPESVACLTAKGAKAAASPAEVASACKTIVTMLPSSPHVKEVYKGSSGIFQGAQGDTLLIDASTIDPATAREIAADATKVKAKYLDAPVSGGTVGATNATLTFMVGGPTSDFDQAKPFLSLMGKNIVHCGSSGNGQVVKICNNMVLAISTIGVSEAMNLGVNLGVDPKLLASVMNTSSARCWSSDTNNPCPGVMEGVPSSRGYSGGFMSDLMKKDLGLAMDASKDSHTPVPFGSMAFNLYQLLSQYGHGSKDFSVVYQFLRNNNNE